MKEFRTVIDAIEGIDLKNDDALLQIETLIKTDLQKLPIFLTDIKIGEPLVRARYLKENESFHELISDYSYNPNVECIKIGRANYQHQPIFYASRFRITALAEVRFIYANKERDEARYSIGRWDVQDKLQVAAIITPDLIRKHKTYELFGLADFIDQMVNDTRQDNELKSFLEVYNYMAKKYTEPIEEGQEYKYKITAAFSNFVYNKLPIADGILYQSVQYPENFNVALKKEVLQGRKLKLTFCANQKFIRIGPLHYREEGSIESDKIDYENGKVLWQ